MPERRSPPSCARVPEWRAGSSARGAEAFAGRAKRARMTSFVPPQVSPQARTLDAAWYVDADVFAAERARIFERDWLCVGHESRIAAPGDYVVELVAGESLIVTRDETGMLHAFYNVCRHRGTRLCERDSGRLVGAIVCPYHAWTYALDGALVAARNMQDVPGFDRSAYPLKRAALRIVAGFVFVSLACEPLDREPALRALEPHLVRWHAAGLREVRRISYDVTCNWKLVFQNYSECYHCPVVHPQLEKLSPSDSGRNDFSTGPVLGGYSDLRPAADSMTMSGRRSWPLIGRVDGEDVRRAYFYTIFPSMMLSLHPELIMIHTVRPVAANRTIVDCAFLFDPATVARTDFDPSDAIDFWDLTNRQDWQICESTHAGITSRAYEPGPYANAEGLLHAFDRHYLDVMGAPASP
jgi:Rieske 2Fe-2S family protein